ncbi:MAG: dicarboxylate/amino acid:cation symporter [Myxococcales bacterium]|nr:dicarboxylate/amino acid:cation symporter [Myxococcales bacterium]
MGAHLRMLLGIAAGAVLGIASRALAPEPALAWTVDHLSRPVGQVFLRLLFMLVVPLLFAALVMGISGLELRKLGRLGLRTLGYTVVVSAIAVLIGMALVNALRPGEGLPEELRELARKTAALTPVPAPPDTKAAALLVSMVPDNPLKAAASGDMIGLIVFSLIFGVGLSFTHTGPAARLREAIEGLYEVMMTLIGGVLRLAPIGVAALLFTMTARLGVEVLQQLLAYVGVVLLALAVHMFVVYSISVRVLGGRSPLRFFSDVRLAIATAFATASSSATLPTALKVAEENLKLPPHVSRFVLTAGSAMNQNGTALFEGVTVLFLAQLFGVELTLAQQLVVMLICILGGIGTAGVPAGSLPVIAMILGIFQIPPEGLGLILGVDRFLDMCRTTLNVTGDLAAAVYVARGEPAAATVPASEAPAFEEAPVNPSPRRG